MPENQFPSAPQAEMPGLLWAYAGKANGDTVRLAPSEIAAALVESDWTWIHVDLIDQRARGWIQSICALPTEVTTLIGGQDAGLSFEQLGAELHGVCADYNVDFLRVSDSIGQFGFVVREGLLVTGWRHPLAGIDAVRQAMRAGTRFASGFAVLAAIIAGFCRVAVQQLRGAEADLDRVEDRLLATHPLDERNALKEVRRLALALHRPVAAMMLLLGELRAEEDPDREEAAEALPPGGAAAIDEMLSRLALLDQAVLNLSDRAKLLQEEIAAELADESNRSLRALTVMTALLLPGSLVAGIFGMNTGGLPFATPGWGTFAALVCGGLATFVFYRILVWAGASLKF